MKLEDLKVITASRPFIQSVRSIFPNAAVYNPYNPPDEVDVVIFTGGSDINPSIYGEEKHPSTYFNQARDEIELSVLRGIFSEQSIQPRAAIGFCRGLQILNAYLGGKLIQNIEPHGGGHEITWITPHRLDSLLYVNSIHHQGFDEKFAAPSATIFAKYNGIVEYAEFDVDGIGLVAGTQFHPEFMRPERGKEILSTILAPILEEEE